MGSVRIRHLNSQLKEHQDALDLMSSVLRTDRHLSRHLAIQAQAATGEPAATLFISHTELEDSIQRCHALLRREIRHLPLIAPSLRKVSEPNLWKAPRRDQEGRLGGNRQAETIGSRQSAGCAKFLDRFHQLPVLS